MMANARSVSMGTYMPKWMPKRKWKTGYVLALAVGLTVELAAGLIRPSPAAAQDQALAVRRPPLRVHVGPAASGRLYRQCTDRPVIEHRAAGDTVVPWTRCWWALR
jgi:hypothetical protein